MGKTFEVRGACGLWDDPEILLVSAETGLAFGANIGFRIGAGAFEASFPSFEMRTAFGWSELATPNGIFSFSCCVAGDCGLRGGDED